MQAAFSPSIFRVSVPLLLAGLLGGCSTFFEKHPTPAAAALASVQQQLAQKDYRIQSVSRLQDVEASETLAKTMNELVNSPDKDEAVSKVASSPTAKATLDMAKAAMTTLAGGKSGADDDKTPMPGGQQASAPRAPDGAMLAGDATSGRPAAKAQKADSDSGDWLAAIAADNRHHKNKFGALIGNLGQGYLNLLRGMQFYSDSGVGHKGKIEYVSGLRYNSRTVNYDYQVPFMLDMSSRHLYWDADQMSILMNPVTREKPVRIDLQPLFRLADVKRLHALWRDQQAYALQHTDASLFAYVPLDTGVDTVPNAYKKIRYQTPLRTALLNYRSYIEEKQADIAAAFHDEATRQSVRQTLGLLLTLTQAADQKGAAAASPTLADALTRLEQQAQSQSQTAGQATPGALGAEPLAGNGVPQEDQPPGKKTSFADMLNHTLDKSNITDWLWLDRQGKLLRADTLQELHLGGDTHWVKVRLSTRKTYGDAPGAPITTINPEQAVSLREAVKDSLAGYLLASLHDLKYKKSKTASTEEAQAGADTAAAAAVPEPARRHSRPRHKRAAR